MLCRATSSGIPYPFVCRVASTNGRLFFDGRQAGGEELPQTGAFTKFVPTSAGAAIHLAKYPNPFQEGDILLVNSDGCRLLFRRGWSNAIFLTNVCNNHCTCCPQPPREDNEDYLAIALVMMELLGEEEISVLGVTGGEPTVVWNKLIPLLQTFSQRTEISVQLLTNGRTLADYDKAAELAEATQGRCLACIPLYSDTHHAHDLITCVSGSFWETIAGIKNLARLTLPVEIRILIAKANYQRLPQIARFIYMNLPFVSHVAFMGIELVGFAARNRTDLWVSPEQYMAYLEEAVHLLRQRKIDVSLYNHPLCLLPSHLVPLSRRSISEWKVRYAEACDQCPMRAICPGCFASTYNSLENQLEFDMTKIAEN